MYLFLLALALPRSVLSVELRIANASEFTSFVDNVDGGTNYSGTTVFLDSDLSLSGANDQIGTSSHPFCGVFDGQGHVISNLKISGSFGYAGLFGYSKDATIRNVVLDGSCSITSSFDGSSQVGNPYVGGIVGYCTASNIENSINMGGVTFDGDLHSTLLIGGIVGNLYSYSSNSPTYVKNCVNYGTVTHSGSAAGFVNIGGIIGLSGGSASNPIYIQNCFNYGAITVRGTSNTLYIGGVDGNSYNTYIDNCVSASKISVTNNPTKSSYRGSILGYVNSNVFINNCHFTSVVGINSLYATNSPKTPNSTEGSSNSPETVNSALVNNLNTQASSNDWCKWVLNSNKASVAFNVNNSNRFSFSSQLVLLPDLAEGSDFKFSGWYKDAHFTTPFTSNEITGGMTLYSGLKVTVTLNANGGSVSPAFKDVVYNGLYGELPTPNRTGYTFTGWFAGIIGGDPISPLTVIPRYFSYSIYAHWSINKYTIKFESNGGSPCSDLKQNYDTSLSLPAPTITGYTFVRWCSDPELTTEYTATKMEANDITLYAKWEANKYIVTFDVNGRDEFTTTTKTVTYDEIYEELPTPNRTGYTFTGWFNGNNESVTNETTVAIPGNHTLHARWEEVQTSHVEIVFGKKDLTKKEVEKIVRRFTDEDFSIVKYEDDNSDGIRVIIEFKDIGDAEKFVRVIRTSSGSTANIIKRVGYITESSISFSPTLSPFVIIRFLCIPIKIILILVESFK